ncbi:MAG: hypothetical protein IJ094_07195 [Bacilli bacterium]|nr:hypothetical protein [Bacilli bacterium]
MLNNKGFAVSAVLYTLLIAFLVFLAVALSELSASSKLLSHANDDLTNGKSGINIVKISDQKKLQITLAGKVFYCDPTIKDSNNPNNCAGKYNFSFKSTDTDYMFYINGTGQPGNSNQCFLPNCVFINKSDYNSAQ